jgi:hypothetical protein
MITSMTPSATASDDSAQSIAPPGTAEALPIGQPADYRIDLGTLGGYEFESDRPTMRVMMDLEGRLAVPQFGLLDVALEGSYFRSGHETGGTFGTSLKLPIFRCGLDYDTNRKEPFVKLTLQGAPRRGGILARGDRLRIDYTPSLRRLEAGIRMPFPWADYRATRPRNAHVAMPRGRLPVSVRAAPDLWAANEVERVRHAMVWVDRLLTPNLTPRNPLSEKGRRAMERAAAAIRDHVRMPGHSFAAEDSAYHAGLRAAFAVAAGANDAQGEVLASSARSVLLHEIIIPYNRLLGRIKRPGSLSGLLERASSEFRAAIDRRDLHLGAAQRDAVHQVFREVLDQLGAVAEAARDRWGTWRLVWLPLNYGLKPEEYDSQAELDAVLGNVMGQPFSSANEVRYVMNERFFLELRRSILETKRYHVLWIHDYSGRNQHKAPDRIAWSLAIDGYVEAFSRAIQAMDRGERMDLPQFFVFLDEHYFQGNGSRKVISFLEHLGTTDAPDLSDPELKARVRAGVARLREAIRTSSTVKRQGERFVRSRVRVQVVITHPFDPTYVDDMVMRDHTKLAFRDVFEEDPESGEAIFTGLGVGEHYVGPLWEDRSLVLRGTGLVEVKSAARELLVTQGIRPDELPSFLRARPVTARYAEVCDSLHAAGWTANVLTVMNGTGFRAKRASVLKAAIYNLMSRGALIVAPDSLWTSDFWAGMFVSAALRGCHAFPIAPARENAPSSALPTLGLMHQTLWAMARSAELLDEGIREAGGTLRVGLYNENRDVDDVRALVGRLLENGWRNTPLGDHIAVHPSVIQILRDESDRLRERYPGPVHILPTENPRKPCLHFKVQFFASGAALSLMRRGDWAPILARYLEVRRVQSLGTATDADIITSAVMRAPAPRAESAQLGAASGDSLSPRDAADLKGAFYLSTLGSHNQDRRSLLLDGEVLTAVAGDECLPALIDFALLMGIVTWPDRADDLHAYFPETGGLLRKLSRWLRDLI